MEINIFFIFLTRAKSTFINFVMELFFALGLPAVLLIGLTLLFMTDGVPDWVQNLNRNSSTIWNFGIVAMSTMTIIIYLAKR